MHDDPNGNHADVNDLKMSYEIHGEGRPLVLLRGGVGAIEIFGGDVPLLVEGRRVVEVDLQAQGLVARMVKLAEGTGVLAAIYLVGERRRDG
jgi:hypothetical protein